MKNPSIVRMAAVYNFHLCRQYRQMEARATATDHNHRPCQELGLMEPQSRRMEARATTTGHNHRPCHLFRRMEAREMDCRPCRQSHPMGAQSMAMHQDHRHYRRFHLVESRATAVDHVMLIGTRSQTRMVLQRTTGEMVARSRLTNQAKVARATMVDQDQDHHHCHPDPKAKGAAPRVKTVESRPYLQYQGVTSRQETTGLQKTNFL